MYEHCTLATFNRNVVGGLFVDLRHAQA